jgi:hypothetical protein
MIPERFIPNQGPEEAIESPKFLLHPQESPGIFDRRLDLETIADDPGVFQKALNLFRIIASNPGGVKIIKRFPKFLPLPQDRQPGQAGLHSLKDQHFEQFSVVMNRNAPFFIMISDV